MRDIRAFFAVELPAEIRSFLADLQNQCKPCGPEVKWVRPDSVHLTLKFLGAVSSDAIPSLEAAARETCEPTPPFTVGLNGAGAFPGLQRPRVVWVGVSDPSNSLSKVSARLDQLLAPLGFPQEKRAFRPHLTLGRSRSERAAPDLSAKIRSLEGMVGPFFSADRLVLFESLLKPSGAEYSRLFEVPFGGTR
jgi:RNA 2',3'-cyclic 3'-phosphodiesterase